MLNKRKLKGDFQTANCANYRELGEENPEDRNRRRRRFAPMGIRIMMMKKVMLILMIISSFIACSRPKPEELFDAVRTNSIDLVEELVQRGADLNTYDENGYSLLHLAIQSGNINLVSILIENKINIEAREDDRRRFTPLMLAVEKGEFEIVKILVDAGADTKAINNDNAIPLLNVLPWTEEKNLHQLAEYLIDKGLDVNVRDKYGMTPLHYAVMGGLFDYIQFLLDHGADPNTMDNNGDMPISFIAYITKTYAEGDKVSNDDIILSQRITNLLEQYMRK